MNKIAIIKLVLFTVLFASCNTNGKNTDCKNRGGEKDESEETVLVNETNEIGEVNEVYQKDSLISKLKLKIERHYENDIGENGDDYTPDLELEGELSYEDEDLLIITFNEIVEYGSWHYSNSSFVFKKTKDQKLLRIFPDRSTMTPESDLNSPLAYDGRINGIPHIVKDLTGDGIKDIIFTSSIMIRSWTENQYDFYTFQDEKLKKSTLAFRAEMDDGCGAEDSVSINEQFDRPLIIVKSRKINCDVETGVRLSVPSSENVVYQWNENEFISGTEVKQKLTTEIQSLEDSLMMLRNLGVINIDARSNLSNAFIEGNKTERASIKEMIDVNNKLGSTYDSLVRQQDEKMDQINRIDEVIHPKDFNAIKESKVQILD